MEILFYFQRLVWIIRLRNFSLRFLAMKRAFWWEITAYLLFSFSCEGKGRWLYLAIMGFIFWASWDWVVIEIWTFYYIKNCIIMIKFLMRKNSEGFTLKISSLNENFCLRNEKWENLSIKSLKFSHFLSIRII